MYLKSDVDLPETAVNEATQPEYVQILISIKFLLSALSVVTEKSTTDSRFELIEDESSIASKRLLWLKVSLIFLTLICIGALVPSIFYFRHKSTNKEDHKQGSEFKSSDSKDQVLVLRTGIREPESPLYVINPLAASNKDFFTTLNIKVEPERRIYPSCSVAWKNNMLLFGRDSQITFLNGCKLNTQNIVWFFIMIFILNF